MEEDELAEGSWLPVRRRSSKRPESRPKQDDKSNSDINTKESGSHGNNKISGKLRGNAKIKSTSKGKDKIQNGKVGDRHGQNQQSSGAARKMNRQHPREGLSAPKTGHENKETEAASASAQTRAYSGTARLLQHPHARIANDTPRLVPSSEKRNLAVPSIWGPVTASTTASMTAEVQFPQPRKDTSSSHALTSSEVQRSSTDSFTVKKKVKPMPSAEIGLGSYLDSALARRKKQNQSAKAREVGLNNTEVKPAPAKPSTKKPSSKPINKRVTANPNALDSTVRSMVRSGKTRPPNAKKSKKISTLKKHLYVDRAIRWRLLRPGLRPIPLQVHPSMHGYVRVHLADILVEPVDHDAASIHESDDEDHLIMEGEDEDGDQEDCDQEDDQAELNSLENTSGGFSGADESYVMVSRHDHVSSDELRDGQDMKEVQESQVDAADAQEQREEDGYENASEEVVNIDDSESRPSGGDGVSDLEIQSEDYENSGDLGTASEQDDCESRGGYLNEKTASYNELSRVDPVVEEDDDIAEHSDVDTTRAEKDSTVEHDEDEGTMGGDEEEHFHEDENEVEYDGDQQHIVEGEQWKLLNEGPVREFLESIMQPSSWDATRISPMFFGCPLVPKTVIESDADNLQTEEVTPAPQDEISKRERRIGLRTKLRPTSLVRDYVDQAMSDEMDDVVASMLRRLIELQERLRMKDEVKSLMRRRMVFGFREVLRGIRSRRCICVIVAFNIEQGRPDDDKGIDSTVREIIDRCTPTEDEIEMGTDGIPVVFALSKAKLGKALKKRVNVSVVGIYSADGAHEEYKRMLRLREPLRNAWAAAVNAERETGVLPLCDTCLGPIERDRFDCTVCHRVRCKSCATSAKARRVICVATVSLLDNSLSSKQYSNSKKKAKRLSQTPDAGNGGEQNGEESTENNAGGTIEGDSRKQKKKALLAQQLPDVESSGPVPCKLVHIARRIPEHLLEDARRRSTIAKQKAAAAAAANRKGRKARKGTQPSEARSRPVISAGDLSQNHDHQQQQQQQQQGSLSSERDSRQVQTVQEEPPSTSSVPNEKAKATKWNVDAAEFVPNVSQFQAMPPVGAMMMPHPYMLVPAYPHYVPQQQHHQLYSQYHQHLLHQASQQQQQPQEQQQQQQQHQQQPPK